MKKVLSILSILGVILVFGSLNGCSESSERSEDEVKIFPLQIWEQDKCIICKDPWTRYQSISEVTNLKSAKNEWGEEGLTADGWVLFNDVELNIPPGGKDYADFVYNFSYYAENCWSNPIRETSVRIGSISSQAKNKDFLYNATNKQKFDVLYKNPSISGNSSPSHACERWGLRLGYGEMIVLSKDFYNHNGINSSLNNSGINFELEVAAEAAEEAVEVTEDYAEAAEEAVEVTEDYEEAAEEAVEVTEDYEEAAEEEIYDAVEEDD